MRQISLRQLLRRGLVIGGVALAAVPALPVAATAAENLALLNNQRIACSRGLSPGKMSTVTCRTYAYLFNTRTSEYFRCTASLSMTRDAREVVNVQTDGGCAPGQRIFDVDSDVGYSFDASETEPPNTNSFFGPGGFVVWASDNAAKKVRSCITVPSGLGKDVSRCPDMKFN